MKFKLILCSLLVAFQFAKADIYTVVNNADSGEGSLRQAITDANNHVGPDKIEFSIPDSDVLSRTITLESLLPDVSGPTIIDATTQGAGNAFGITYTRIQLTTQVAGLNQAFLFAADSCEVYGFFIHNFINGITVLGTYVKIGAIQKGNVILNCSTSAISIQFTNHAALQGNLIGVDTMGVMMTGATGDGIQIVNTYLVSIGGKTLLANNVISGNNYGIKLQNATFVDVNSNNIGTNPAGLIAQPNAYGIYCTGVNNNIEIGGDSLFEQNVISGNTNAGIYGVLSNSAIEGNVIGLTITGEPLGNGTNGIYFNFGSTDNVIGGELLKGNTIAKNGQEAIAFQNATCQRNTITRNRIYCNSAVSGSGGIKLNGANSNINAPQLSIVTASGIAGTTVPNGIVEIFANDTCTFCEGKNHIATVTANANGAFIYNAAISGSVTATVTDAEGNTSAFATCADTTIGNCIVAGFITSIVHCENQPVSFLDQTVTDPSTEISSWDWNFGDGVTSTEPSPEHAFATDGTFSVQLIATNSNGCSDTIIKSIVINDLPVADFNALPVACVNTAVHFVDASTGGTGGNISSRNWDFGDGFSSTGVNPSHTYDSAGIYTVTLIVTNSFGCTGSTSNTVEIAPNAVASFTYEASNLIVNFTNTSTFNGPHASEWDFGDGNTSTLENTVNAYANAGTYNVCLTVYDSLCQSESTSCNLLDIVTGIQDLENQVQVYVYPNPAKDYLMINYSSADLKNIRLTALEGSIVLSTTGQSLTQNTIRISLPELATGLYLLYLETDKGVIAKKIVIE
ncbi:MAG: PKD domain-containing protein [Chitinophagaceae bacterium]|nr:PKD domain-containing protein [Chitinophagaceae bacterium]